MREANLEFLEWMEKQGISFETGGHQFERIFDHLHLREWNTSVEAVWALLNHDFEQYMALRFSWILSPGQIKAIVKMYHELQSKDSHIHGYYSDQLVLDRDGAFHQTAKALGCQGITTKGRRCGNSLVANPEQTFLNCGAFIEGVDVPAGSLFRWFCEHHEHQRNELRPGPN
ncbi:MAG TPA: hypothetical protein VFO10_18100 [Oligoflexus sp.]|uniref:hypothetical protein n=1 Tax=Oligoflexus sp. TaxID=1971216 RepID=UPI002D7F440C|nr:hypothetical protein [Oligoflexus sp.]HET9239178.1 hypothetical protein [Oligoflexus sp.]